MLGGMVAGGEEFASRPGRSANSESRCLSKLLAENRIVSPGLVLNPQHSW